MVNNFNIAYDIVRQQTMLYVSIRCRTSAYDVVRQHTMSYVTVTSAYYVVRQHTVGGSSQPRITWMQIAMVGQPIKSGGIQMEGIQVDVWLP